jgi:hypothetical protein
MNEQLLYFYLNEGTDNRDRMLCEIVNKDDTWWEKSHDFIQWVFPTTQLSAINPHAPIVDVDDIVAFRNNPTVQENLERSLIRFMRFLRLDQSNPWWVYASPHNYMRITRALLSLNTVLNDSAIAMMLYSQVRRLAETHPTRLDMSLTEFWTPAMEVM